MASATERFRWLVLALIAAAVATFALAPLDRVAYEALLALAPPPADHDPVVVVGVRAWPVSRAVIARAVRRIRAAGARVLALDIGLEEIPNDDPLRGPAPSSELRDALQGDMPVVLATARAGAGSFRAPAPPFAMLTNGFNASAHFQVDPDGVTRSVRLSTTDGERRLWALGFKLAQFHLRIPDHGLNSEPLPARVPLGPAEIGLTDGAMFIRFGAAQGAEIVLEDWLGSAPSVDRMLFADRAVLIGATAGDAFAVPVLKRSPGVRVHAEVARTLLRGDAPRLASGAELAIAVLVVALVFGLLRDLIGPGRVTTSVLVVLALLALGIAVLVSLVEFAHRDLVLPLSALLVAGLVNGALPLWLRHRGATA